MKNYCFVSYYITERCNYRCAYCNYIYPYGAKKALYRVKRALKPRVAREPRHELYRDLDAVIDNFRRTGKRITFGFTGGEPLVYPRFLDICKRLASFDEFMVALDTNLSVKVDRFVEAVPPEKVEYIYTSLHAEERERLSGGYEAFLDTVLDLKGRGYPVDVSYVLYPPLFERFERDYRRCAERGIRLDLSRFKGVYEGKLYPDSYTEEQKDVFRRYAPGESDDMRFARRFRGRMCVAGKNLVYVRGGGEVVRCPADYTILGNIFTGFELFASAKPCVVDSCPCYSPERLLAEDDAARRVPGRMSFATRIRLARNKLKCWWDQD